MTTLELLAEIRSRNVSIWADGERLCYSGDSTLPDELQKKMACHKLDLIAILSASKGFESIGQANRSQPIPLSLAQRRLWFLEQLLPPRGIYNLTTSYRLSGSIQPDLLEKAIHQIVCRHESLRTAFVLAGNEPAQVIQPDLFVPLNVFDLSNLSHDLQETEVSRVASREASLQFDLRRPPLLRTSLMVLAESASVFVVTFHHLICDAWSQRLFFQEMEWRYRALLEGRDPAVPDLPVQYADYAVWQHRVSNSTSARNGVEYWRYRLAGLECLELPTDRPRPESPSFGGARKYLGLRPELIAGVEALGLQHSATLFITLMAAFQVLLSRSCGGVERLAIGTPVAGRPRAELEPLIGFFVNMIVLSGDLSGDPSFEEFLERTREAAVGAYSHQDVPFDRVVEVLRLDRDLSRNPIFQVSFQLLQFQVDSAAEGSPASVLPQFELSTSPFDLSVTLWPDAGGIGGSVQYSTDLFDADTISRMIANFETLLASAIETPSQCIWDLRMTGSQGEQDWIAASCGTDEPYPQRCLHDLWEVQAEQTPDLTAVLTVHEQLTYRELHRRAGALADRLRAVGAGVGVFVGLCVERSAEMAVGLLAILKSGGAYVPLDAAYPDERLAYMLADSAVSLLLTERSLEKRLESLNGMTRTVLCVDDPVHEETSRQTFDSRPGPDDAAYLIYTSGSTGQPKGVVINHRGLVNVAARQVQLFGLGHADRVLQLASLSFDASIFEFLMAWSVGAALCIPDGMDVLPGPQLVRLVNQWQITAITAPPTVLACLPEDGCGSLRLINAAGEVCGPELAARWATGRRFFNLYGPTEGTIWATAEEYRADRSLSLGRPIGNVRAYVVDRRGRPAPMGGPGELWLGGVGIGVEYWRRSKLTAERFTIDPFLPGGRVYRTGDMVRWLSDNRLQFLGRVDRGQVKIRGQRVELGEVEAALNLHPEVAACVVETTGDTLTAYVVPLLKGRGPDMVLRLQVDLRDHLRRRLPTAMIPAAITILEALPLTPTGKLDRHALPPVGGADSRSARTHVLPRTDLERLIAEVWSQVLRLEGVGAEDGFFELGGHSLLVVAAQSKLSHALGREIPIVEFFRNRTVADMARWIERGSETVRLAQAGERARKQLTARQNVKVAR